MPQPQAGTPVEPARKAEGSDELADGVQVQRAAVWTSVWPVAGELSLPAASVVISGRGNFLFLSHGVGMRHSEDGMKPRAGESGVRGKEILP